MSKTRYYNVTINSTGPIFFYCAALKSCVTELMVRVINQDDAQTLDKQIQAAREAKHQLAPGDANPPEGGFTSTATLYPGATSMPSYTAVPGGHTHGYLLPE
jgi:hypothetical protein